MIKKLNFALIFYAALFGCTLSYAGNTHIMRAGITLEFELPPNEPQLFVNYLFWSVEAYCKITTEEQSINLFVEAIAKKGKVNDIPLSAGESLKFNAHPGEVIKINADSGAKVQLTNMSNSMAHATCTDHK